MRAVAVAMVFLHHNTALGSRLDLGRYGVWLFFVLSGFLIIGILHQARRKIEAGAGTFGPEIGDFFKRRSLRIFPIYYLTLAVVLPLALKSHKIDLTGTVMLATYTANVWIAGLGHWPHSFSHLWSLSIEEQFYLFAAALFLLVPSRRHFIVCLGLMATALVVELILLAEHASVIRIYNNSLINFGFIALGGATFLLTGLTPRQGRRSFVALAMLAAFLCTPLLGAVVRSSAAGAFVSLGAAALLLASLFRNQASALVALLEFAPLRWLGRVSYGFYLFHNFLSVHQMGEAAYRIGMHLPFVALLALSFVVSTAAATASWWLIERPIQSLGRRPTPIAEPALA